MRNNNDNIIVPFIIELLFLLLLVQNKEIINYWNEEFFSIAGTSKMNHDVVPSTFRNRITDIGLFQGNFRASHQFNAPLQYVHVGLFSGGKGMPL